MPSGDGANEWLAHFLADLQPSWSSRFHGALGLLRFSLCGQTGRAGHEPDAEQIRCTSHRGEQLGHRTSRQLSWRLLPESYLMGITDGIHYAAQQYPIFLLGHDYAHGVWWYFPVALSIKTTLGLIGLVVLAGIALISRRLRQSRGVGVPGCAWRAIYLTAAVILSGMNIGTRHVLFLYPPGRIDGSSGSHMRSRAKHSRRWMWIGGGLVAVSYRFCHGCFSPVAEMAYGNEAWGGTANTHKYLERLQCGLGAATATR